MACDNYKHVLAVVCALTKFTLYIPVKTTTAVETLDALISHVFSIFGHPLIIIADNGGAFANKLMEASEQLYGYRMIHVMPHTPMANGLAEAAVKKLKIALDRHAGSDYNGWKALLPAIQSCVNPRILREVESRKAEYLARYSTDASDVTVVPKTVPIPAAPARIQPSRLSRAQPMFLLTVLGDGTDCVLFTHACSILRADSGKRTQSLRQLEDIPWETYLDAESSRTTANSRG